MPHTEFLADRKEAGLTVAELLRKRFGLTWNQAKRLIENGHVRVAGGRCSDPAHRIRAKNRVWVREGTIENKSPQPKASHQPAAKPKPKPKPIATPLPVARPATVPVSSEAIVYADDAIVVVDKPAGLTTQRHAEEAAEFGPRGRTYLPKTLADFLPALLGRPGTKVIPVHRIDRDTSGLVVFARTAAAAESLTRQFRKHTANRRYLALVRGSPRDGRLDSVLLRDRGDGRRGSSSDPKAEGGKRAVTHVHVVAQLGRFAVVECRLETGRTHQVRIHLGEAGWPLCGETVYDRPVDGKPALDESGAARPMLHAARLGIEHPETGDQMTWDAPPPKDFTALWEKLKRSGER